MPIHLIQIYSEEIGMSLRLEKNGWIVVKREKAFKIDEVELPTGHIADIQISYM